MPLTDWSIEMYKQQWKEGLERIEKTSFSCLVTTVQHLDKNALIELWVLYKENNTIFLQHSLITRSMIQELNLPLNLAAFTPKNCYEDAPFPRETITEEGNAVYEWEINYDDFFKSQEKSF